MRPWPWPKATCEERVNLVARSKSIVVGGEQRQELKQEAVKTLCRLGYCLAACSACFFILSRTTCPAVAPLTETGALFLQSLVKKMPPHTCLQALSLGDFLKRCSSCKIMPACIKLAKWNTTKQNKIKTRKQANVPRECLQGHQTKGRCWEICSVRLHLLPLKQLFHWVLWVRKPSDTPLSASCGATCRPRHGSAHSFSGGWGELNSGLHSCSATALLSPPRAVFLDSTSLTFKNCDYNVITFLLSLFCLQNLPYTPSHTFSNSWPLL